MSKKILFLSLLLIPLYFVTKDEYPPESKKRVRIGVLPAEISLPFYISQKEEIFKHFGWNVEIIPFQSAIELNQSF